jgi:hypothetical protein
VFFNTLGVCVRGIFLFLSEEVFVQQTEQVLVLSFDSFDDFDVKMRRKAAHQAVSIRKAQKH